MSDIWLTLPDETRVYPGDLIRLTVGGEIYVGYLDVIGDGFITVAQTDYSPIPDYLGSSLGFPIADITRIEAIGA